MISFSIATLATTKLDLKLHLFSLKRINIRDRRFLNGDSLRKHVFNVRNNDRPTYKCMICEKQYKHKQTLAYHLKRHSGDLLFPCDTCKSAFISRSYLLRHKWQMHREMCYKCKTFGKKFVNSAHLNSHIEQAHIKNSFRIFRS
jgi:hypothetical protein